MKKESKYLLAFLICCFGTLILKGQTAIPATGSNATGSSGSVSYSVGQLACNTISGSGATINQGVQQPFEISVVTGIEKAGIINHECIVYPNPTSDKVKLVFGSYDNSELRYQLYDISGVLLLDKKLESKETEISLGDQTSSVYFLKILRSNLEIKIFTIIKK